MRSVLLLLLSLAAPALSAPTVHVNIAGRDVAVWKPASPAPPTGYPVVVFSHGYGGCNTQSEFLMEALAQAGYLVLAPNHKDAKCAAVREGGKQWKTAILSGPRPEQPFRREDLWNSSTYKDRAADIRAVLDGALSGRALPSVRTDPQKVGVAGHSLGGYTALELAGAWPSWKDVRIRAVLALSPFAAPYVKRGDLGHMNVPVMYQGGTRDQQISPVVRQAGGVYDRSSSPKYYVEFEGAGHFAWTNFNPRFQQVISQYGVAFFNRYLKGMSNPDPLAPLLLDKSKPPQVSLVRSNPK
jgi:predicted dienelactone hydrolase